MRAGRALVLPGVLAATLLWAVGLIDTAAEASATERPYDFRAEKLAETFDRWKSEKHSNPASYEILVGLSWIPGISAERSGARGLAIIDMNAGTVAVELGRVDLESLGDVWLIDNRPGAGVSAMPDPTDAMHLVGSLEVENGYATLRAEVGTALLRDFDVEQVVVTRRDEGPVTGGLLYGTLPLFERLHRVSWRVEQGLAPVAGDESSRNGVLGEFPRTTEAAASSEAALRTMGLLIDEGEDLFENETFDGNGRTCETCHPAENNRTLDAQYISTLPPDDPLFVAEFIPELNHELNGGLFFENPVLMRAFGLIVENPDGFDDLGNKYALRSPNTISAMALTITPIDSTHCDTVPPLHRTGWSGDGAPGSGTVREFAIGAIVQHAPLTLERVLGEDYRLPTEQELDALEAFQFSLGRQEELDLVSMVFTDPNVSTGRDLFLPNEFGRCHACHDNAGALRENPPGSGNPGKNHEFDIGIDHVVHPAEPLGEPMPFDDGFGDMNEAPHGDCRFTFNTPSLIEAADTAPFEHNNAFATLEEAIVHYTTPEFLENSSSGRLVSMSPNGPIELTEEEVGQISALLRVLNALFNIDEVTKCDARVLATTTLAESRRLLKVCIADNRDAIDVLSAAPLAPLHPIARNHLNASLNLHRQAGSTTSVAVRNAALAAAAVELTAARADMLDENP